MQCLHPINIRNPSYNPLIGQSLYVQVPCGKCIACQERRRSEWAYRLETESKRKSAYFVTLTYEDEHLPLFNPDSGEFVPTGTLAPEDVTRFLKRFRKRYEEGALQYFYCGEYGAIGNRPHYHIIMYLEDSLESIQVNLEDTWKLGFISVSPAILERFRYVAKYVVKLGNDRIDPSALQPFARMSNRIMIDGDKKKTRGLGLPPEDVLQWHRDNDDWSSRLSDGEIIPTPRYIRNRTFYNPIEVELHKKRLDEISQHRFDWIERQEPYCKFAQRVRSDQLAWERFKIKQFYEHYLKKQNGRF